MLPKLRPFLRIKEKYNPKPNAREMRHHIRLCNLPCIACGGAGGVFHHLLSEATGKRWRRDHEFGLPMCDHCHRALHAHGDERTWCQVQGFDAGTEAEMSRLESIQQGIL
jgi:hypothetical protein